MSKPIQTVPYSLLGGLALKQMGQNPPELIDKVQPSIDLWRQYMDAGRLWTVSYVTIPTGDAAPTRLITITTGDSNIAWWIHGGRIQLASNAGATGGDSIILSPYHGDNTNFDWYRKIGESCGNLSVPASTTTIQYSSAIEGGFLLKPTESIFLVNDVNQGVAAAEWGGGLCLAYTAIPV